MYVIVKKLSAISLPFMVKSGQGLNTNSKQLGMSLLTELANGMTKVITTSVPFLRPD